MKKITFLAPALAVISSVIVGCTTTDSSSKPTPAMAPSAATAEKARASHASVGYTDTPMLPGGKWHVHDPARPQPRVVTPGTFSIPEKPGAPPSDAVVLFDGKDLSNWKDAGGNPSGWVVRDGAMIVPPKGTAHGGDIFSRQEFGDCQLHVEFATPTPPKGDS